MKNITTFDEHLDQRYGKIGTEKRTEFEIKAKAFAIGEILREARKEANMAQIYICPGYVTALLMRALA